MNDGGGRRLGAVCALALGALWACPHGTRPNDSFRAQAEEAAFGRTLPGALGGAGASARTYRFELPAFGALLLALETAEPANSVDLEVYGAGDRPLATTQGQPEKRLLVEDLPAGRYWVVARGAEGQVSRFALRARFKPADPDAQNPAGHTRATARPLPLEGEVADGVDYSAMRRTHVWRLHLDEQGTVSLQFDDGGAALTATLEPAEGEPQPIAPGKGLAVELPRGDHYVLVRAQGAGDAGRYRLSARFSAADACKNGGSVCGPRGAELLTLPSDTRQGMVDATAARRFHWYRLELREAGRLTVTLKPTQPHGTRAAIDLLLQPEGASERLPAGGASHDLPAGTAYLRLSAPEGAGPVEYQLQTVFQPASAIEADVVEVQRSPCVLTVGAGSDRGVRVGAACTLSGPSPGVLDSCVVDRVFPTLAKVRPLSPGCHVPQNGAHVAIER